MEHNDILSLQEFKLINPYRKRKQKGCMLDKQLMRHFVDLQETVIVI
jgi:hypothetical protein